ncbi:MAG: PilN domain-containing protein [Leptolyngbyaceae bacterium]|nr:PilN domain-containing protein [Leptolyngbyaceae bacterium]
MYSLDINFLNDREERPVGVESGRAGGAAGGQVNWTPAVLGAVIGLVPAFGVLGYWFITNQSIAQLQTEKTRLEGEIAQQGEVQAQVAAAQARADAAEADVKALVTVFDQIKPWSAMMFNIRETIPSGVQVTNVQQSEVVDEAGLTRQNIELRGVALTFDDVNDFVLVLRRSPFLNGEETNLASARLIDNPEVITLPEDTPSGIEIRQPKVVEYTINAALSDRPASELFDELESTLAVGLTERIRTLQDKGAF